MKSFSGFSFFFVFSVGLGLGVFGALGSLGTLGSFAGLGCLGCLAGLDSDSEDFFFSAFGFGGSFVLGLSDLTILYSIEILYEKLV